MKLAAVESMVFISAFVALACLASCGPVPASILAEDHGEDLTNEPSDDPSEGDDDTALADDDTAAADDDTAAACVDKCPTAGQFDCTATADGTVVCADHDGDGCVEWGGYVACSGTEFCDDGECVDECVEPGDDCEEWDDCCDLDEYHCCPVFHICVDNWWQ
jgi:hypothetical protein